MITIGEKLIQVISMPSIAYSLCLYSVLNKTILFEEKVLILNINHFNYIFMFDVWYLHTFLLNSQSWCYYLSTVPTTHMVGCVERVVSWVCVLPEVPEPVRRLRELLLEHPQHSPSPNPTRTVPTFKQTILTTKNNYEMNTVCLFQVLSLRHHIMLKAVGPRVWARFVHPEAFPQMWHTCDTLLARRVTAWRRFLK